MKTDFRHVRSVGRLLPLRLLERIVQQAPGDGLGGRSPADYGLSTQNGLQEAINRSFETLQPRWQAFRKMVSCTGLPEQALATTADFVGQLLAELGYRHLEQFGAMKIDGRTFELALRWAHMPIHVVHAGAPLEHLAGASGATQASPHAQIQSFLNACNDSVWGMLSNGGVLRLIRDNRNVSRPAYLEFDLDGIFANQSFNEFRALWLVCHASRMGPVSGEDGSKTPTDTTLERWYQEGINSRKRTVAALQAGVRLSVTALGCGFLSPSANRQLCDYLGNDLEHHREFYRQLLRLVYRLLFLMMAETRNVLQAPSADVVTRDRFRRHYSIERLREMAQDFREDQQSDLYEGVKVLTRALDGGAVAQQLGVVPMGGGLWSAASTELLNTAELCNHDLLEAIRAISVTSETGSPVRIDYGDLGGEEIGSVYEKLLELNPIIEPHSIHHRERFVLQTTHGNDRQTSGSFYTPSALVQYLLDSALEPAMQAKVEGKKDAEAAEALLSMKVCDPAVGSGNILIAAAHRIAAKVARFRTGDDHPGDAAHRMALRDVIRRCLYGIDINPMSVELCKVAFWMESVEPGRPLPFLDSHIVVGNGLIGATPALLKQGIPDECFGVLEGDNSQVCSELKRANRIEREEGLAGQGLFDFLAERALPSVPAFADALLGEEQSPSDVSELASLFRQFLDTPEYRNAKLAADAWCAAFFWRKDGTCTAGLRGVTTATLREIQSNPERFPPDSPVHEEIDRLATRHGFLHLHLTFPDVCGSERWGEPALSAEHGFDVVLGNPPFLNQLETATATNGAMANIVRACSRGVIRGYADLSATFLLVSTRWLNTSGWLAMVQPQSFLAARDAAPIRQAILENCSLNSLWVANEQMFDDAFVLTCVPTLHRGGPRSLLLRRAATGRFTQLPPKTICMDELCHQETWSHLTAVASGVPEVVLETVADLGTIAYVTADFRDQYYGLRGFLLEDADLSESRRNPVECPIIVTTGLIDLAQCHWGHAPTRILKSKWQAPRVDRVRMNDSGSLGDWITNRLIPKVLVATQTRVIEAWVDEFAQVVPSIPLLTVTPRAGQDLWWIAAAVASPVVASIALCRYAGAAMSADTIKLSATQLTRMPLPTDSVRWEAAAGHFRRAQRADDSAVRGHWLHQFGESMSLAYGLDAGDAGRVLSWWKDRLSKRTSAGGCNAEA